MPGYNRLHLPAEYQAMANLTGRGFAWEWLRRDAEFRSISAAAGAAARRASELADAAVRRSARAVVDIPQHPLARRWSRWGLFFRARP